MALRPLEAYVAYLAARHEQDQEAIAASLAVDLYPLWTMVDFQSLDKTMPMWLAGVLPRIKTAYLQSQRVAAVFTQNVRFASLPLDEPLHIAVPNVEKPLSISTNAFAMPDLGLGLLRDITAPFETQRVATSLTVEANYKTKKAMPGLEDELMDNALVRSSGAAVKEAINGSRDVVKNITRIDQKLIGYARVTDSNPCHFCALLASRGAVYEEDSFSPENDTRKEGRKSDADFTPNKNAPDLPEGFSDVAKVHNNCKCTLRPVYAKSQSLDEAARYYRKGWKNVYNANPKMSSTGQVNEFRKWLKNNPYEGSQLDIYKLEQELRDRENSLLQAGFHPNSPQVKWAIAQRNNFAA
ncbi:MAG: hypothetical protein A4E20_10810 [Nitrospira sp. SG-bin2]|uniref:VG15 protein n=1 Tax=Nitrospira cf. moscoviensis SBR1015 TaxID=96242 RepID=UPI000A0C3474|nr:hypothetical protein [Nitrospira cf. moscoviensis SBR1015]OQW34502.1 MAG: hypothetical protein A4E20_10810 [Nitrospira sp. SG-bin2]